MQVAGNVLPYWGDESAHRGFLLNLGRSVGGTHFLVIDADEILVVGDCRAEDYDELRRAMLEMKDGDIFVLQVRRFFHLYSALSTE